MLKTEQTNFLVDKGIIHVGSMIQVDKEQYHGQFIKDYRVTDVKKVNDEWFVTALDLEEPEHIITICANRIVVLDDMTIERVMEAYTVDDELSLIDVIKKTDVTKDIIGKKTAKINGIQLEDGMRIVLHKDVVAKLNNKPLTVRNVGDSIKLVAPRGRPKKNG